jgi:hypothetical protein
MYGLASVAPYVYSKFPLIINQESGPVLLVCIPASEGFTVFLEGKGPNLADTTNAKVAPPYIIELLLKGRCQYYICVLYQAHCVGKSSVRRRGTQLR